MTVDCKIMICYFRGHSLLIWGLGSGICVTLVHPTAKWVGRGQIRCDWVTRWLCYDWQLRKDIKKSVHFLGIGLGTTRLMSLRYYKVTLDAIQSPTYYWFFVGTYHLEAWLSSFFSLSMHIFIPCFQSTWSYGSETITKARDWIIFYDVPFSFSRLNVFFVNSFIC